nr:hypothetical protein [Paenibacillus xylanexedens]
MRLYEAIAAFPGKLGRQQAVCEAFGVWGGACVASCRVDRTVREVLCERAHNCCG